MKEEGYEEERLEAAGWTGVKVYMYVAAYSHVLYYVYDNVTCINNEVRKDLPDIRECDP